jgi:3-methyladenine DNA glycosylase AlkD
MLHPQKNRVSQRRAGSPSPRNAARNAKRALATVGRRAGKFDASRYFRGSGDLGFYNVGTPAVRRMATSLAHEYRPVWTLADALTFADTLIKDRYLEAKEIGIEVLASFRRDFTPWLLPAWKRWLANNHAANWATTDSLCGTLIGPLLVAHPHLVKDVVRWSRHKNLWVRRASAVGLLASVRKATALDEAYRVASALHADRADLIQKAVGWMLREAGKIDPDRLERYLRANGPSIPRTTVRYAIERFSIVKRRTLLEATRPDGR